jgi:hypothetical protein
VAINATGFVLLVLVLFIIFQIIVLILIVIGLLNGEDLITIEMRTMIWKMMKSTSTSMSNSLPLGRPRRPVNKGQQISLLRFVCRLVWSGRRESVAVQSLVLRAR